MHHASLGHGLRLGLGALLFLSMLGPVDGWAQSRPVGRMLGRLLDDGGKPVTGATLLLNGPGYTGTAVTNNFGVYVFVDVPAGTAYTLRTRKTGYTPTSTSVRINPNYTVRHTLKLSNPRAEQEAARRAAEAAAATTAAAAADRALPTVQVSAPVVPPTDLPTATSAVVPVSNADIADFVDSSDPMVIDSTALDPLPESEPVADEASAITTFEDVPGVLAEVIGGPAALAAAMEYPAEARRRNAQGIATVRVRIDQTGAPVGAEVLRSSMNQAIDEAALATVMGVRYTPAMQRNQPVSSALVLRLNFKLKE